MGDYEYGDGGLPGGVPEQMVCDCGPCPGCSEDSQMSSPCQLHLGHDELHQCVYGHEWIQAGPSDTPLRERCGGPCPTNDGCNGSCIKDRVHNIPHWCGRHEW
jgi:hypothetical protein